MNAANSTTTTTAAIIPHGAERLLTSVVRALRTALLLFAVGRDELPDWIGFEKTMGVLRRQPLLASEDGAVVVEDAHRVAFSAGAEQALFHLWNLCAARGCWLLLTARKPPRDWDLSLPDLRSRMSAMPVTRIEAPDEALLAAVLVKLLADRQLTPPPGLIDWLVPRMDRDLGLARRLVAALDTEAMAERRALTRTMAGDLLEQLTTPEGTAPDGPLTEGQLSF